MTTSLQVYVAGGSGVSPDNLNTFQQTCDSMAILRSFVGITGVQVFVRGTAVPNDGGQGEFYWNAGGIAPDDNGITTVVPNGSTPTSGEWTRIAAAGTISTLSVTGNATIGGTLAVTGATTLSNTLGVAGVATFAVSPLVPTPTASGQAANKSYVDAAVAAGSSSTQIQSVSASVAANALTAGYAGGSLSFRNATLTNGAPTSISVGALTITVPSTATLGTVSGQQAQLILLVAYNAGTPVLCIVNAGGGTNVNLDETTLISPTTISTGATSPSTIYSASTVAANSPFRLVGYINITEATAGTWATAPSLVQGQGGQALSTLQSLGYGQTWQTPARALATSYYNTTSRPIMISVSATSTSGSNLVISINGSTAAASANGVGNTITTVAIVPPSGSYVANVSAGTPTLEFWTELR